MNRFCIVIVFLFLFSIKGLGHTIKDFFLALPSSQIDYMSVDFRKKLLDSYEKGKSCELENILNENSRIDTLTETFLSIRTSKSSCMMIKKFVYNFSDVIICMVRTYFAPMPESVVELYDEHLNRKAVLDLRTLLLSSIGEGSNDLFAKINENMNPLFFSATLSADNDDLVVCVDSPMDFQKKRGENQHILQRKLKWDNKNFN